MGGHVNESNRALSVDQVAARLNVAPRTVLALIANGAMRATNVGTSTRPRWRISESDLRAFHVERSSQPRERSV